MQAVSIGAQHAHSRQIKRLRVQITIAMWRFATDSTSLRRFTTTLLGHNNFPKALQEDRGHARAPGIRESKELVAWGGVNLNETTNTTLEQRLSIFNTEDSKDVLDIICAEPWPVNPKVKDFVLKGYMRGWNLSGPNVNLEEGTAIVTRRADAKRWNDACLTQIHQTWAPGCKH